MPKQHYEYPKEVLLSAAKVFLDNPNPDLTKREMAKMVNQECKAINFKKLNRETFYTCIAEAVKKGVVRIVPQRELEYEKNLARLFSLEPGSIHVVSTTQRNGQFVSAAAAARVAEIIESLAAKGKKTVGLGLGAGSATLDFCRHLSHRLDVDPPDCALKLVALSAACPPREPSLTPVSFFNLFSDDLVKERVGLLAEPLVTNADFGRIRKNPWIEEAFAARADVDIIVTAMGYIRDPDDKLGQLLEQCGIARDSLEAAGWLGNIQYRPYSKSGPILGNDSDLRVVTLFEVEDLKGFVERKEKHIVLIVRQSIQSGITKEAALLPLIENFRVFTELIVDSTTAARLVNLRGKT